MRVLLYANRSEERHACAETDATSVRVRVRVSVMGRFRVSGKFRVSVRWG